MLFLINNLKLYSRNVSGVVVAISLLTLFSSTTAFAQQVVTGRGAAWTWWGSSTAAFTAEYTAKSRALTDLNKKARLTCPRGYKVLSGPFCKSSHKLVVKTNRGKFVWPRFIARAVCKAKISCNKSKRFPNFQKLANAPIVSKERLLSKSIFSIKQRYETLSQADSPGKLNQLVAKWETSEFDQAAFENDLYNAAASKPVKAPTYSEYLSQFKSLIYSEEGQLD